MSETTKELSTELDDVNKNMKLLLKNRNDDYEYGRDILYAAAESLMDILESAKQLAQESEHPRAIEVATNTATSLADVAGKMMEHQIKTKRLNSEEEAKHSTTNNLNVKLNTKDLLELLNKE